MSAEAVAIGTGEDKVKPRIKRTREGYVLSDKMDKTVTVEVTRLIRHPQFKKIVRRKIKYAVHDEANAAKVGDKVRIQQTRPLSKTKRWTLVQVLEKKV